MTFSAELLKQQNITHLNQLFYGVQKQHIAVWYKTKLVVISMTVKKLA